MAEWSKEIRETLHLGVPMAGAQLSQILMNTTDVALVGRLSGDALAAMAVGQAAYGMLLSVGIGLVAAVGPMVSQAHGAGNNPAIARTVAVGVYVSFLVGLLFCLPLYFVDKLFLYLEYSPEMTQLATGYTRAVMLGLPFAFLFLVQKNYMDSISKPRLPMLIATVGVVVNAIADYAFMYGRLGFPTLGVTGTGLATTAVNLFMALVMLPLVWSPQLTAAVKATRARVWREFFEVGLPIAGSIGIEVGLFVVGALMMGKLGSDEAAAHQIVLVCAAATFMVPLGISFAGSTRVGQAVGRRDFAAVRPAGISAIAVGSGFMLFTATLFLLTPGTFVEIFWEPGIEKSAAVKTYAMQLLVIAGFFQIFDGMQVTAMGALRGIKDVKIPLVIGGLSYWVVGLGSATYLTFYTELRHRGLWLGFLFGLATAGIVLTLRFLALSSQLVSDKELQRRVSVEAINEDME